MMLDEESEEAPTCKQCSTAVECCAFCERKDCSETICHRCLRIALGQSLAHPYVLFSPASDSAP
jgi:hypothetical protein